MSSLSGRGAAPAHALAACSAVRTFLQLTPVAQAFREFARSALDVVLTYAPKEEDVLTWSGRRRLVDFLHMVSSADGWEMHTRQHTANVLAGSVIAFQRGRDDVCDAVCQGCRCRHIVIQEALRLTCYCEKTLAKNSFATKAGMDLSLPHLEDGIGQLLGVAHDMLSFQHPACYERICANGNGNDAALSFLGCLNGLHAGALSAGSEVWCWRHLSTSPLAMLALSAVQEQIDELDRKASSLCVKQPPEAHRLLLHPRQPDAGFARFPPTCAALGNTAS